MTRWLKNSKGLTLVELLAVVVILGIIAAIAVPVISGTIENSRERADLASLELVREAANRWAIDHEVENFQVVSMLELVNSGYLQGPTPLELQSVDRTFDQANIDVNTNGTYAITIWDLNPQQNIEDALNP